MKELPLVVQYQYVSIYLVTPRIGPTKSTEWISMKTEMNVLSSECFDWSKWLGFDVDETNWCLPSEKQRIKSKYQSINENLTSLENVWCCERFLRRNMICVRSMVGDDSATLLFGYWNVPHLICPTSCMPCQCNGTSIATSSRPKLHSIRLAEPLSKTLDLKETSTYTCADAISHAY